MSYLGLISITPIGSKESVSSDVAKAVKILSENKINYQLTSMGTIIETEDLDQLLDLVKKMIAKVEEDNNRVSVILKIDCRKGHSNRMKSKVESVLQKL
ncbi:MAG: MTH1187 family thiamine-binding protein [bacterium]